MWKDFRKFSNGASASDTNTSKQLCQRCCARRFTRVSSTLPTLPATGKETLLSPWDRWGNWGSRRWSKSQYVTWPATAEREFKPKLAGFSTHVLILNTPPPHPVPLLKVDKGPHSLMPRMFCSVLFTPFTMSCLHIYFKPHHSPTWTICFGGLFPLLGIPCSPAPCT